MKLKRNLQSIYVQDVNLSIQLNTNYVLACSYPLTPSAFEEMKSEEDRKLKILEEKHSQEIKSIREEMNNQFNQLISMIQQNPNLAQVKPEVLISKNKV